MTENIAQARSGVHMSSVLLNDAGLRTAWRLPAIIYFAAATLLAGAFALTQWLGIPFVDLTRDAAIVYTKEAPLYGGYLSNLGAVLWTISATSCFFAAATLHPSHPMRREMWLFLMWFGALTAILLVDDLFMMHEFILQQFGRSQKGMVLAEGLLAVWIFLRFQKCILKTHWILISRWRSSRRNITICWRMV